MRVAIAGAGGHAKVVGDALLAADRDALAGFLDDDPRQQGGQVLGYPVLGAIATWSRHRVDGLVVAVGDNRRRKALYEHLTEQGAVLINVLHPRAVIGRGVALGRGIVAFANVVINADSAIGDDVILNTACTVDHDCLVDAHAHLAPGVRLAGAVHIGEGVFLGVGAVVIPGVSVGAWATVGAGAVVIRHVRPGATVVGVPAREV
jgi:sugar O-acyltransferase (sialic acid O-acetyltransferase NeuD family)